MLLPEGLGNHMSAVLFASPDSSSSALSSSDTEHVAPWERHGGFLLYLLLVLYICLAFEILISLSCNQHQWCHTHGFFEELTSVPFPCHR